jgi:hypothetical protein
LPEVGIGKYASAMEDDPPDWRTHHGGQRVHVALWLASEVGEGGVFTMEDLRDALGGAGDVSRRLRDLRSAGWVIETTRDNAHLKEKQLRLAKMGSPVWDPKHRADGLRLHTSTLRRSVLERDHHRCVRCGVGAGETYPDNPSRTARLVINYVVPLAAGGTDTEDNLVTECTLCSRSEPRDTRDVTTADDVWHQVADLPHRDQTRVLAWLVKGRRDLTPAEAAFVAAWRLPPEERTTFMSRLADAVAG